MTVDSGDLFPVDDDVSRIRCMLGLYRIMRYDAVAIGDQEMEWYRTLLRAPGQGPRDFPWMSTLARRQDPAGGGAASPLALSSKLIDLAGLRIGLVCILGSEAFRFCEDKLTGFQLPDPAGVIRDFVAATKGRVDLVVVMSHQGMDADRRMAAGLTGVDLIVGGHSQSLANPPVVVNGIPIVQAGRNGENMGIVLIAPRPQEGRSASGVDFSAGGSDRRTSDPFCAAVTETPRWTLASALLPLDRRIDEHPFADTLIERYYADEDVKREQWARNGEASNPGLPSLHVENSVQQTVVRWGARQLFNVTLRNDGEAPLVIRQVRSKAPWLRIKACPGVLDPGASAAVELELVATNLDRSFRSEFTITSNDRRRAVVQGTVNGRVEGPIPDIIDVGDLLKSLRARLRPVISAVAEPAKAGTEGVASGDGGDQAAPRRIPVEFFFTAGCADCDEVKSTVLVELAQVYGRSVDIREYDIHDMTNYVRLARLQERLGVRTVESVAVYVDGRIPLEGVKAIQRELLAQVGALVAKGAPSGSPIPGRPDGERALQSP